MNKIVKRNGQVVDFEPEKVRKAIEKANAEVALSIFCAKAK